MQCSLHLAACFVAITTVPPAGSQCKNVTAKLTNQPSCEGGEEIRESTSMQQPMGKEMKACM